VFEELKAQGYTERDILNALGDNTSELSFEDRLEHFRETREYNAIAPSVKRWAKQWAAAHPNIDWEPPAVDREWKWWGLADTEQDINEILDRMYKEHQEREAEQAERERFHSQVTFVVLALLIGGSLLLGWLGYLK
jgi:hypothetical protein